ncbi:MAG: hypothetical protein Q9227_003750 [Pyrenula ochraceoflavens]
MRAKHSDEPLLFGNPFIMAATSCVAMFSLFLAVVGVSLADTLYLFHICPANSVFYAFVGPGFPDPPQFNSLPAGEGQGKGVNFPYSKFVNPGKGNISLKVARTQNPGPNEPIEQIEFGVDYQAGKVWYDLSVLNGNPFFSDGIEIYVSECGQKAKGFDNCLTLDCPPSYDCVDGYKTPTDPGQTRSCSVDTDLIVGFCTGQGFGDASCP